MLRTSDLDYDLPQDRIATRAAEPRESARLLVTGRTGDEIHDRTVGDLPELLMPGDVLVFNSTRVLPARLLGFREPSMGKVEGLFLRSEGAGLWRCLLRAGHLKNGARVRLLGTDEAPSELSLVLVDRAADDEGAWIVRVDGGSGGLDDLLRVGRTPLPPYILKARQTAGVRVDDSADRARYQTVFARDAAGGLDAKAEGSVAAPTAGLHFSDGLLSRLRERGVEQRDVTLHVGIGTFRPVEAEFVEQHPMHEEWCSISRETIEAIGQARKEGRRIIAVGTTSARTLEAYAAATEGGHVPESLSTRILITPGYRWRWCDGMVTNFHLPRSTLMAMVASLLAGGVTRLKSLYAHGVEFGYRFYSFGDAMLVLPDRGKTPA